MRVPLNAAKAVRRAIARFYGIPADAEWMPKIYEGSHEEVDPDSWVISWEEGVDYDWVYDEDVRLHMEFVLKQYALTNTPNIKYRVEAVNHWCMAVYAEPVS